MGIILATYKAINTRGESADDQPSPLWTFVPTLTIKVLNFAL